MTQLRDQTSQERKRPDAAESAAIVAANTRSGTNGSSSDTGNRRRDSEGGLNLKPSGRTHGSSASALEDRSAQATGQTIGHIAVENPVFSCRDVSVYYGQKHALKKVSIDVAASRCWP